MEIVYNPGPSLGGRQIGGQNLKEQAIEKEDAAGTVV